MAKKGNRQICNLECSVCRNKNYLTSKNVISTKDKLSLRKFCKKCKKVTLHNESKIK